MQFTPEQVQWLQSQIAAGVPQDVAINQLMQYLGGQQATASVAAQEQPQVVVQQAHGVFDINQVMALAAVAAEEEDHSAIVAGKLPRQGLAWLRVRGYVEIGVHKPSDPKQTPKEYTLTVFELHHPDHLIARDGVMVPDEITVRMPKSHSNASRFPVYFKALARALEKNADGSEITHMSQAIGRGCLGEIYHNASQDGSKKYANLDLDKAWSFKPSRYKDPATNEERQVAIPALVGAPLLFLMDNAAINKNPAHVKAMWDCIHIDGTRKSKDASGMETEQSRNYYQELIAKSMHWQASETKRILDSQGCTTYFGANNAENQATLTAAPIHVPAQVGVAVQPAALPATGGMPIGHGAAAPAMPQFPADPALASAGLPQSIGVPAQAATAVQEMAPVAGVAMATAGAVAGLPTGFPAGIAPQQQVAPAQQAVAQPSMTPMNAADFMKQFAQ